MSSGRPTPPELLRDDARMLVVGGPGTGKTATLCERFAGLIEAGADPERVALFVLTRRAADRAREAVLARLRRPLPDLHIFTVQSFCFGVLSRGFTDLGYPREPTILGASEQLATVAEILGGERPEDWPHLGSLIHTRTFARDAALFVLRAQEHLLDPDLLERRAVERGLPGHAEAARFAGRYLAAMGAASRIDFAGLVQQAAVLVARAPEALFDHVLADDYQEATPAQEAIHSALVRTARSAVLAVDPQGGVLSLPVGHRPLDRIAESFGGLAPLTLSESFRATAAPVRALDGETETEIGGIETRLYPHPGEEAEGIAAELLRLRVDSEIPWARMAVIVRRYSSFLAGLRHALDRDGIPHTVAGEAASLRTDPAVRPVLELFRYVIRDGERDERLEPLLVSPVGGFTPHEVRRLRREARITGVGLRALVESDATVSEDLHPRVAAFRGLVREVKSGIATKPPAELFDDLWRKLSYFAGLVGAPAEDLDAARALDAISALAGMLHEFGKREPGARIDVFLDLIDTADAAIDPWFLPRGRRQDAVQIATPQLVHGAEFDAVIVAGCLEGEFPTLSRAEPLVSLDDVIDDALPAERRRRLLAAERKLFRLAVSRARTLAVLSASTGGTARSPRTPSRYASAVGVVWRPAPPPSHPTSLPAIEASLRRTIADPAAPHAARLAALAALPRTGADPASWWGRRDWTDPGASLYADGVRTSYSHMSAMENCALQFLYQSEMGLDTRETHQMWLGTVVHQIIERVHAGEIPREEGALVAALDELWRPEVFGTKAVEHRRYVDAKAMLARWLGQSHADPVAVEESFEYELDGAAIRGRIDAIFTMSNGHVRVVDYKTGRSRPPPPEDDLQLAVYYLGMVRDPELARLGKPGVLELHFIAQPRAREGYSQVRFPPNRIDGFEGIAADRMTSLIRRMRAEQFGPSPEADCMWCRFKTLCPLWPEGAEATSG